MKSNVKIGILGLCGESVFLSVDHFHSPGETISAHGLYREPGGKGYNQAVAAARLGAQVCFLACCGRDAAADSCRSLLAREGVEAHIQEADAATAYAAILTDRQGENRVTVHRGAAELLTAGFVREQWEALVDCDVLLLNLEVPSAANEEALAIAGGTEAIRILNPAPAQRLRPDLLCAFDVITPNRSEAETLFGLPGGAELSRLAEAMLAAGIRRAAVTLGSAGALLIEESAAWQLPPLSCPVVDTTGAGDCFSAALALSLGRGESLTEAAVCAQNAAALSIGRPYVIAALPTAAELAKAFQPLTPRRIL